MQSEKSLRNTCFREEDKQPSESSWKKFENVFNYELLPYETTTQGSKKTSQFLLEVVDILLDYIKKNNDRSYKVLDFHHPHSLRNALGPCLNLDDDPKDLEQILIDCKETLKFCVKTGHPRFFNQLSTGLDLIALAGEWLTAAANTNMFTYEIAPVFTLMEDIVLAKMRDIIGWPDNNCDGVFAPGGAISNLYAVLAARYRICPEIKEHGMEVSPKLVMFTSEYSHFSIKRSAAILGIGTNNCIGIKTDSKGKMMVKDLEKQIEKTLASGAIPFFVSATGGTTVLGSFDPIWEISDIAIKYGLWLHVDCAWGGGALLSKSHRKLLNGIDRADSVTWNPHKLMGATLQCSAVLMKEKGILEKCNSLRAKYLFQQDKHYDITYDKGDKAIQCGRHNDIFKLWLMWRAKGDSGLESQIDKLMDLSLYLQKKLRDKEGFQFVINEPEFLNVCFWYVPKNVRYIEKGCRRDALLDKVAPKIKSMMMETGTTMVGYQPLGDLPNFFRMIVSNPATIPDDIDFLLEEIERLGEDL
ncbi:DgyrCDS12720 [Dimorphilus gyrociliatus]|uniref:DgyrCDS12720 n=1 Tax=Dimorphilus gyrociliatus TaxID=2664684 RepID=A0A7I8W7B9_9ANNE|nr:DgyrCDS12720 [Dimorphilus gyrociliatus]